MKLPRSFTTAAEKYGVQKKDILFAAAADFDMEYRFADSIVAVTKDCLLIAAYPCEGKAEYRLGGYGGWQLQEEAALSKEPALCLYEWKRVARLEVLRQISSGALLAEIDGVERDLCHFSNTRMEAFLRICKLGDKIKKQEEILPEDLDITKGKECCPKCGMLYPDQERKVCPKCMDKKSILFRVMAYFKPYKASLAVMILCYLGTAVLNLVWPYLSGTVLYDQVLAKNEAFLAMLHIPAGRFLTALVVITLAMILTKVTIQALGWREGGRYLPLQDDIASVAYWYQTLPAAPFPALPDREFLEII